MILPIDLRVSYTWGQLASAAQRRGRPRPVNADDRCQCPHWGYVIKGKMTARYADRDEVFEAGDAFYTPPGHIPVTNEPGTEFVSFSPSEELRTAEAVMMKNMQAMQDGRGRPDDPSQRRAERYPNLGRTPRHTSAGGSLWTRQRSTYCAWS